MTASETIEAYKKAKNIRTDSELARVLDVDPSFIWLLKHGKRKPGNKIHKRAPELYIDLLAESVIAPMEKRSG